MSAPECECDYPLSICALHGAAADMYAALLDCIEGLTLDRATCDGTAEAAVLKAEAAIAKAEGR